MNRYTVVRGMTDVENSVQGNNLANWLVVDLSSNVMAVVADCGDVQGYANKAALALNALDGGPL